MRTAVRKLGNSCGIIIPKSMLTEAGVCLGDTVEMTLEEGRIVLAPVERQVRTGWAAASKRLVEAHDDALVWPEFANADDDSLNW